MTIKQTVTPSRARPGERIKIVRETRFSFPAVDYLPSRTCRSRTRPAGQAEYVHGGYYPEPTYRFHSYRVGDGPLSFMEGPGTILTGDLPTEGEPTYLVKNEVQNCEQVTVWTETGEFYLDSSGAHYVTMGAPAFSRIVANGKEVPLSSVDYQVKGSPPIVEVSQMPPETLRQRSEKECTRKNSGDARVPWNEPKVYRQLEYDICVAAMRFGISPILLAILLQYEGSGRTRWMQSSIDKWVEENVHPFGKNETIGPGQMRPDLAAELSREFDDRPLTEHSARDSSLMIRSSR